jgi:hypothetical protein
VRLEAARSSITLRPPLEPSIYAALARDPDPRIRSVIATRRDSELPTTTFLPAYNQLAADSDPSVLNEFDASFAWMCESDAFKDDSQDVVELLKRRHANRSIEIQGRYADVIYGRALGTSAGVSTIMNWALDGQDDKLLERAVRSMPAPQDEATRVAVNASVWRPEVIDDATLERIYVRIYTLSRVAFDSFQDKLCVLSQAGRARVAAKLPVIGDTKRARQLRLAAARVAAPAGGEPVLAALRALFTDICWSQSDPTPEEFRTLQMIGGVLPAQDQEQLALQLATTSAVPDAVAVNLLVGMDKNRKYPSQAVRPILDRWFARVVKPRPAAEVAKQVVRRALLAIPNEHDDALSKYLIAAIGDPQLGWDATHQMGQLRWPEFLDPLGQLLMHNPSESGGAIESITGYMNDDAAKYLLQAAGSTSDNDIRKACFAGLESIRKYQDETARWNLRKSGQRARDEAVQQLLPMLDDSDATVRAQAARSLATLDAVEYLPRLVKMLKDPAPEVREAAKKALETLNASGAKKP